MRKVGSSRGMVSAYPRQLESLIRLAEAHAKVRFSNKVEAIDVEEAKRLHREALKQSATDPRTGIVDISILTTGRPSPDVGAALSRVRGPHDHAMGWTETDGGALGLALSHPVVQARSDSGPREGGSAPVWTAGLCLSGK